MSRKSNEERNRSPESPFIFKECEPFKWFGLPTFRAGKTMYHMQQGKVHIMRERYALLVYASIEDLKMLKSMGRSTFKNALPFKSSNNKFQLLKGFLDEVDLSKIGSDEHRTAKDEKQVEGSMSIRRVPLTEDEQNEICPECGHRRGLHHNPDDRCCETGCNCGYYFYGPKKKNNGGKAAARS
jgi:hypothetical protein